MAGSRRADHEQVNVFEVDEIYLFKHYFDSEEVFDRLKKYYNNQQYRFEIPPSEYEDLRQFLEERGYALVVIEELSLFMVVVEKYTAHPENIFKASVIQRAIDGYNCFLLTGQEAVEQAVQNEAIRFTERNLGNPF